MQVSEFFDHLWQDYIQMTPQAEIIQKALIARNESVVNDHVAFRTFNIGPMRLEKLEPLILDLGYQRYEPYHFAAKHLDAVGYIPPQSDLPRIFISELRVEELSTAAQKIIHTIIDQIPIQETLDASLFWHGRFWPAPRFEDYQTLLAESEYAAWLSIVGLRANHFTISINALNSLNDVAEMNELIEDLGFTINDSGGRIKGSPEVLLEQSSTKASRESMAFADGREELVTTCYYEFAKRYHDDSGELYQGFVAASADKIFESTDVNS